MPLPVLESYLRNLITSVNSYLGKLSSPEPTRNDLQLVISSDISSLPFALSIFNGKISHIREFFLKSKLEKDAMGDLELWGLMEEFIDTLDKL